VWVVGVVERHEVAGFLRKKKIGEGGLSVLGFQSSFSFSVSGL
jgi:hypothetical protein